MNWQPYAGVISVSICTVLLYYAFLVRLMVVKISLYREHAARGEDFDRYLSRNPRLHAADRAHLNMLEHLPTFNLVLWLNAWVVSPSSAAAGGTVWLLARAAYPFLVGSTLGRDVPVRVLFATFTGYAAVAYLAGSVAVRILQRAM